MIIMLHEPSFGISIGIGQLCGFILVPDAILARSKQPYRAPDAESFRNADVADVLSQPTGLFNPAMSGVAMGSLPQRHSGLAAGAYDTFRQAGIAVGIAALGALIPASSALGHGSPQAYVHGLREALVVGAGLAALGAVATARLLRGRRNGMEVVEAAAETA